MINFQEDTWRDIRAQALPLLLQVGSDGADEEMGQARATTLCWCPAGCRGTRVESHDVSHLRPRRWGFPEEASKELPLSLAL